MQIELLRPGVDPPPPCGFGAMNEDVGPLAWLDAPDQFPNYVLSTDDWAAAWGHARPTARRRMYFTKTAALESSATVTLEYPHLGETLPSPSRASRNLRLPARTTVGLPSGVPPLEMACRRAGLKVVWMIHSTIRLSLPGCDLRRAPPRHFGLRPSAIRSDTKCGLRRTRKSAATLCLYICFTKSRTVLLVASR